jgi:hypothetical protein
VSVTEPTLPFDDCPATWRLFASISVHVDAQTGEVWAEYWGGGPVEQLERTGPWRTINAMLDEVARVLGHRRQLEKERGAP